MNKVEIKRTMQKSKDVCMWCQLLYLIPGATLCCNYLCSYSDVKSMKPPLPQSFSFFFFIEKIFKNGKYTVEMRTYAPSLNPVLPVRTCTLSSWFPTPPTCIRTLWMAPSFSYTPSYNICWLVSSQLCMFDDVN